MIRKKTKKNNDDSEKFSDEEEKDPEDIYDEDTREEMLEGDEITASEEGFMRGWEGSIEGGKKRKKDSEHEDPTSVELAKDAYKED